MHQLLAITLYSIKIAGLVVETVLPLQAAQIRPLVRQLRLHATWPKINENKIDIYNIENKHCWHNPTPRKTEKTSGTGTKARLVMPRVYRGRGAFSDWISFQIRKWGESKKMCHQATLCFSIINHDCAFSTWKEKGGGDSNPCLESSSDCILLLASLSSLYRLKKLDVWHMRSPSSACVIQRVDCLKGRWSVSPQKVRSPLRRCPSSVNWIE